jgi:hypothetical protein
MAVSAIMDAISPVLLIAVIISHIALLNLRSAEDPLGYYLITNSDQLLTKTYNFNQ